MILFILILALWIIPCFINIFLVKKMLTNSKLFRNISLSEAVGNVILTFVPIGALILTIGYVSMIIEESNVDGEDFLKKVFGIK